MKRATCVLWFLMVFAFVDLVVAQTSKASPVYSLIGLWEVPASESRLFEELFTKHQKPILDKFLADGTLIEWGFDSAAIHRPEGYTHSRWISAKSRGNVEKAISAIIEAFEKMPAEERAKMDKDFARMVKKHRDYLVTTEQYQAKPGHYSKGYIAVSFWQAKPGKMPELNEFYVKYQKPVYDQLFKDGVILSHGVDTELYHTEAPGGVNTWYVIPDMAAEDKVDQAFEKAREALTQEERDSISNRMRELTEPEKHRDFLSVIRHYNVRAIRPSS